MIFNDYADFDGIGLANLIRQGTLSPEDLIETALDNISELNPHINCVVQKLPANAKKELKKAKPGAPFYGVPFLVKEFGMHFKGMQSQAGSRLGKGYIHPHDSELMKRCRHSGLITIGTTTTPEMAFNANTEAIVYGSTRNPWNLKYSVGGSSGGSAAAVAAGIVPIAHANDGGGSIRIPAACNGLVGMKPSRGRTPSGPDSGIFLWGLGIEFAVTRTVRDSAALLDAISGPDDGYFYTAEPPKKSFLHAAINPSEKTLRIGFLHQLPGTAPANKDVQQKLKKTIKLLREMGHICEPLKLKYDAEAFNESTIRLWAATLGFYIEHFAKSTNQKVSAKTVEAITLETYRYAKQLNAIEMEWAMNIQNNVSREVGRAMQKFDIIVTPGLGREISLLGELDQNKKGMGIAEWWKQLMFDYSQFTPLFNTTGQPAIMLPLHQSKSGLPMAIQFVGRLGDEETLYSLAGQLEQMLPWNNRKPPIHSCKKHEINGE